MITAKLMRIDAFFDVGMDCNKTVIAADRATGFGHQELRKRGQHEKKKTEFKEL
jgi:hypothetical protein